MCSITIEVVLEAVILLIMLLSACVLCWDASCVAGLVQLQLDVALLDAAQLCGYGNKDRGIL